MADLSDDGSIADQEQLWRRIPPRWWVKDEQLGRLRPSSAAFTNDPDGSPMSIQIASVLAANGLGPGHVLAGPQHRGFALASVTAGSVRQLGQGVMRTPLPGDPAHGEVLGHKPKRVQKALARQAMWVVPPSA
jgi:hypothetical protein